MLLGFMHQSFATTSPSGPGNSGDIDFSLSKAQVYAQHCRDTLMVKALRKSPLKSRQVNVNFHGHFGTGIKTSAIPRHCGDNAEVKTLQLSPAMPPAIPGPKGAVVANDWCITNKIDSLCCNFPCCGNFFKYKI